MRDAAAFFSVKNCFIVCVHLVYIVQTALCDVVCLYAYPHLSRSLSLSSLSVCVAHSPRIHWKFTRRKAQYIFRIILYIYCVVWLLAGYNSCLAGWLVCLLTVTALLLLLMLLSVLYTFHVHILNEERVVTLFLSISLSFSISLPLSLSLSILFCLLHSHLNTKQYNTVVDVPSFNFNLFHTKRFKKKKIQADWSPI